MSIISFILAFGSQIRPVTAASLLTDRGPSTASTAVSSSPAAGLLGGSFVHEKGERNAEAGASSLLVRRERKAVVEVMPDGTLNQVRIEANTEAPLSNAARREQEKSSVEELFDEGEGSGRRRRRRRRRRGTAGRFDVKGKMVQYWRNQPLRDESKAFDRAVIVIHGTLRNADKYYERAAIACGVHCLHPLQTTLLFAPKFKAAEDDPGDDELYWSDQYDWKVGYKSGDGTSTSSFEVIDDLLASISKRFSKVTQIVIVGHSAGGQFVQRYAGFGKGPNDIRSGIDVCYVVANPSSYMYLTSARPFKTAYADYNLKDNCSTTYDDYKYGMADWSVRRRRSKSVDSKFPYATLDTSDIQNNLVKRDVVLLLGTDDDKPRGPDNAHLDVACPANAQGNNRYQRGLKYYEYVKMFDGKAHTSLSEVKGVGHKSGDMFQSSKGRKAIFNL